MKKLISLMCLCILAVSAFSQNDNSLELNAPGSITSPASLGLDEGTVALYFKADPADYTVGTQHTILSIEDATADNVFAIRLGNPDANTPGWGDGIGVWSKRTFEDTAPADVAPYGGSPGSTTTLYRTSFTNTVNAIDLYDGNWHHLLVSISSGSVAIMLDGVQVTTGAENQMVPFAYPSDIYVEETAFTTNATTFSLSTPDGFISPNGTSGTEVLAGFPGQIDELIVLDVSTTEAQYQADYDSGDDSYCITSTDPEVALYFDFDDATFTDSSSNSGTLTGYTGADLLADVPYATCAAGPIAPPVQLLNLYPNPVTGPSLTAGPVDEVYKYKVFDGYGNSYTTTAYHNGEGIVIDISTLTPGVYGLAVGDSNGIRKAKFLKS